MTEPTALPGNLIHERVDDIVLLLGIMEQLGVPELLDAAIGTHGLHQGLSNGILAVVWIAYILSEGDHRKSTVQDWVDRHRRTLERFFDRPFRPVELNDDRLGILLRRLSDTEAWDAFESVLWQATMTVVEIEAVRLDSTTTYGYHTPTEDGVMQLGYSKDHRPDRPQLKLMAAAAQPSGHWLAADVVPGQTADDGLYLPIAARVREMTGRRGLLYIGDSKMAAGAIRADFVGHGDDYLCPLPRTGRTAQELDGWIDAIVEGEQPAELVVSEKGLIAAGYEFERRLTARVPFLAIQPEIEWTERVLVIRSLAQAQRQAQALDERLAQANDALRRLTPSVGKGRRQIRDEATLQGEIARVLERHQVTGLLSVAWEREEATTARYVGSGRPSPERPTQSETQVRYQITDVSVKGDARDRQRSRLGWQALVTSTPKERLSLTAAVIGYRQVDPIEGGFHLLKDRPLGIHPLYVQRDDQIVGLTRLLTLALRLLTLIQTQVRRGLAETGDGLAGLHPEAPRKTTERPTARRLLQAFERAEIALMGAEIAGQTVWQITPIPAHLVPIFGFLGLPSTLYQRLLRNPSFPSSVLRE